MFPYTSNKVTRSVTSGKKETPNYFEHEYKLEWPEGECNGGDVLRMFGAECGRDDEGNVTLTFTSDIDVLRLASLAFKQYYTEADTVERLRVRREREGRVNNRPANRLNF